MKKHIAKLKPYHFYVFVGGFALIWMLFFDLNSVWGRVETARQIRKLEEDLAFYQKEKLAVQESRFILESDATELERFARERYRAKKTDETLFVIVDPKDAD